jgi:hypothetical protein
MTHHPQFTLKDMLVGTGLIAVGLAMVSVSKSPMFSDVGKWTAGVPLGLWYAGGMFMVVVRWLPLRRLCSVLGSVYLCLAFSICDFEIAI